MPKGFYRSAKQKQGNTNGNRLEKQFAAPWLKSGAVEAMQGTVKFPRGLLAHANETCTGTEAVKLAEKLLDKANVSHLLYHLDKLCF